MSSAGNLVVVADWQIHPKCSNFMKFSSYSPKELCRIAAFIINEGGILE
jgi:hypothetical protein